VICALLSSLALAALAAPQDTALPVAHWLIHESRYANGEIVAAKGPNLMVSGFPKPERLDGSDGYKIADEGECFVYPWDDRSRWPSMPKRDFTISVRFAVPNAQGVQGLVGCIFEPEEGLQGWRIVIRDGKPEFTVAKPGLKTAIVTGQAALTAHRVHRIDASYDGAEVRMYVDGACQGTAPAPFGDLIYNGRAGICFADWWEGPRSYRFTGSLFESALFDRALAPEEVEKALATSDVAPMPSEDASPLRLTIAPFFQYPTTSEATVAWETSRTSSTKVRFGLSAQAATELAGPDERIHHVVLPNLKPATTYFVQVESTSKGETVKSEWASFRTASLPGTGVKVAIVGDTQDHPETNHVVADAMYAERPDAVVIAGDLVGMGWKKEQWEHDFFASMRPLFDHVPLLPVIGNHDRNARIYYDLMATPAPEYCYTYTTGDVQFFMIDTNRDVRPSSPQYRWLESALKASTAKWKIAVHHHPPYSSDNDDFGDSNVGPTTDGEVDVRPLCRLYDKYGVDFCFAGHIHSYERTYPIKAGKIVSEGQGTVYIVVGGGGGDLETPKPTRSVYSRIVRRVNHFGMIAADARSLEFRAYDDKGQLFDIYTVTKP